MSYTISNLFARAMRYPHQAAFRVEAWANGAQVTPDRYLVDGLPITPGGAVTVDAGSQVRRTLAVTIADPGLTPADAQSLLAPYGTELRVWRGITFPNGDQELVPLGRFLIDSVTPSDPAGVPGPTGIDITASDYSRNLVDGRFFIPTKATETTVALEIKKLVRDVMPDNTDLLNDLTTSTVSMPAHTIWTDNDRAGAVSRLATLCHAEFFMDPLGVPTLRPLKTPAFEPNWTINAGEGGVMISASTAIDRANIYNGVIVTGQRTDGTASGWGIVLDEGNASPTQWGGPFGKKVVFVTSAVVHTTDACHALAQQLLDSYTGAGWTISLATLVNPALEAGDVVTVNLPDGRIQKHLVESFAVPLDGVTGMTLATRSNDPAGDSGA